MEAAGPVAAFVCVRADLQYPNLTEWIDHVTAQLDLGTLRWELLDLARPSLAADDPERTTLALQGGVTGDFEHLLSLACAQLERYTDPNTARNACEQARATPDGPTFAVSVSGALSDAPGRPRIVRSTLWLLTSWPLRAAAP